MRLQGGRAGEEREGRTRMGVEAVQAQYEAGLYQIISCHTDDDAAAELTPGLAFPVNAAANQTHLPPFTLSSSVSSRPASVSSPSHLCSLSSMFDRSPLHPLPFFSSLSLSSFPYGARQRCLFRFLSAHTEGSDERLRS